MIYKENFLVWRLLAYRVLVGDFDFYGILDYIFVLPGLVKLACRRDNTSIHQRLLCGFSDFLSIINHIAASILLMVFTPLLYVAYKYIIYKGKKLKEDILEMEVLPVDQEKIKELGYRNGHYINREKLTHMFYGENKHNRIKLKDHPNLNQFMRQNMESHMLKTISIRHHGDKILGLFPCHACYCGISSSGHEPYEDADRDTFPVILIIPSKENSKEIQAIKKYNAFFFSEGRLYDKDQKTIEQYLLREDPFKQIERQMRQPITKRRTIQFALQQATNHSVSNTGMAPLNNAIDPLITVISQFAGAGPLNDTDLEFGKNLVAHNLFQTPSKPWITESSNEFKRNRTHTS